MSGSRVQAAAGSFFDGVPADGDLYVLQHVLHDWDDSSATRILRNCHQAGRAGHTLAVVELLLPEQPGYWLYAAAGWPLARRLRRDDLGRVAGSAGPPRRGSNLRGGGNPPGGGVRPLRRAARRPA